MQLEEIRKNPAKKILQFSVPAIISMVLTALITVADGFFMGNYVGKEGIAAVNLGLPMIYLYLGVGLMISIGGVAIAGMALGSGDTDFANQVFRQTITTTVIVSGLISIILVFCFSPMLSVLRADEITKGYFREYYRIMLLELPVMVVNSSFGMFIRGEGNPGFFMKVTVVNVLLNVAFDYIFSAVLSLGAAGIAMASLVSALVSFVCILYYFLGGADACGYEKVSFQQAKLSFQRAKVYRLGKFHFSFKLCIRGILNGSSEFIGEMSTGIAMFAYNFVIMKKFGVDGVTAFTIVGYVSYLFSMVIVGFGQGSSPLISFCYGAEEKTLAAAIRKRTNRYVFLAGAAVVLVMALFSEPYSRVFVRNESVQTMIRAGMMIFMTSFFFSGINSITSFYFTATGRAFASAAISFSRGLFVLLICIFTLPVLFGMTGVWMAAPVTEVVTIGITAGFLYRENWAGGKIYRENQAGGGNLY